ncbi:MAG: DUF2059 domain-containing protein [Bacteroidales bacterium]|nr:DUF2059 domain-containing protein [Bacteroidales bacterium]
MKRIICMMALALMACNVFAQDAAFKKEVEKTLELTNMEATLAEAMRLQYQQLVDAGTIKLDDVQATADECAAAMMPKMKEFMLQVYYENYTLSDMKEYNKFLTSPLGQKFIKATPKITNASTKLGQDPEILTKLQSVIMKHLKLD